MDTDRTTTSRITNAEFSKKDPAFKEACEKARVERTPRQASKYRNQKGSAWKARKPKDGA